MTVVNLTEARIRDLAYGSGIWRDEQVKGLMVICHATTKSFAVQGDVRRNGRHVRTVRVKIDRVDRIGLREARRKARELMSIIQSGVDPTARPQESGITLAQALEKHLGEKPLRAATEASYRYNVDHYLARFRSKAIADLTRRDVREFYDSLKSRSGQTTATCVMRTMRAIINTAMRLDETLKSNPVAFIRIPNPSRREVDSLDLAGWWETTEALSPIRRDLHRAMLLTGARRSSVLQVRRNDVDFDKGILIFNHMKTGGRMLFPMGRWLAATLKARLDDDEPLNNPWLWPSTASGKGCTTEPKERKRGLPSPHEYRHHARTLFIAAGVSALSPDATAALAALIGEYDTRGASGYILTENFFSWFEERFNGLFTIEGPRGAGRDIELNTIFKDFPGQYPCDFVIRKADTKEVLAIGFARYDSTRGGAQSDDRTGGNAYKVSKAKEYCDKTGDKLRLVFLADGPGLGHKDTWYEACDLDGSWDGNVRVTTMKLADVRVTKDWLMRVASN